MRYKGTTPVKTGDKVDLLDEAGQAYETISVADALASQFTVTKNRRVRYFFYEDKGLTWMPHPKG